MIAVLNRLVLGHSSNAKNDQFQDCTGRMMTYAVNQVAIVLFIFNDTIGLLFIFHSMSSSTCQEKME